VYSGDTNPAAPFISAPKSGTIAAMKIAVLLSGGVDSSVALNLLLQQGYTDITAFYLKIWLEDEMAYMGSCPWEEDLRYAEAVCEQAGVPLKVLPLQQQYYDRVVSYAIDELRAGRTPSPDHTASCVRRFAACRRSTAQLVG